MTGMAKRALVGVALLSTTLACLTGSRVATAAATPITEFTAGVGTGPASLTVGPDGNLWFVDQGSIKRITPTGQVAAPFTAGLDAGSAPQSIETGGDGNLWFTDVGTTKAIGVITPSGQITEFAAGTHGLNPGAVPEELADGPDDSLWFVDNGTPTRAIGRIAKSGVITEFPYSTDPNDTFNAITEGPDGNIYVTVQGNNPGIGEVNATTGVVTKVPHGMAAPANLPNDVTAGPDGSVWYDDPDATTVSRLTPGTTSITDFGTANGLQTGAQPDAMTAGPDANVWFIDQLSAHDAVGKITPAGVISESPLPATPWGITPGIDGNLWVPIGDMGGVNAVARVTPTGTITPFSAGLGPDATFGDGSDIIVGPDGNLWTIDEGTTKAIVRVDVQLPPSATTGAVKMVTSSGAAVAGAVNPRGSTASVVIDYGTTAALGTTAAAGSVPASNAPAAVSAALSGLAANTVYYYRVAATNSYGTATGTTQSFTTAAAPATTTKPTKPTKPTTAAPPRTLTARAGNQRITVELPAADVCVAPTASLPVTVNSAALTGVSGSQLHFRSVALFLDGGVRRTRLVHRRSKTGTKRVKVVVYAPNATSRHVPATIDPPLRGLAGGAHGLRVTLTYTRSAIRHGRRMTTTVTRTVRSKFRVC